MDETANTQQQQRASQYRPIYGPIWPSIGITQGDAVLPFATTKQKRHCIHKRNMAVSRLFACLETLGCSQLWAPIWAHMGPNMGPKLAQDWPIMSPRWAQYGPKTGPIWGPIMGPSWSRSGSIHGPPWAKIWAPYGPMHGPIYGPIFGIMGP